MNPSNHQRPLRTPTRVPRRWAVAWVGLVIGGVAVAQTQVYSSRPLAPPPPSPHLFAPNTVSTSSSPSAGAAPPLAIDMPPAMAPRVPRIGRVAELVQGGTAWDLEQRRWTPLFLNRPVVAGDRLRSEAQGRIELQVGSLDVILGPGSELEFPALEDSRVMVRLVQGSLVVRTRQDHWSRTLELLTDEGRLQPLGLGLIRLDRDRSTSRSSATALAGVWRLRDPGPAVDLPAGRRLTLDGSAATPTVSAAGPAGSDAWSRWVAALDPMPPAPPLGDLLPEVTGADVLHRHGRWEQHPQWGAVWWPSTVPPNWEPYRSGRWMPVQSGTWVWWEDAPWGFAPFHYGSWVQWSGRWVWAPRLHRPHPAPFPHRPRSPTVVVPPTVVIPVTPVSPPPVIHEERTVRTPRWGRELEGPMVDRPVMPREPLAQPAPAMPAPRVFPPGVEERGPRESTGERGRIAVQ